KFENLSCSITKSDTPPQHTHQFMNISDDELLKNPPYQLAYKIDKLISPSEDS
ncbi:7649_t:CDS:1, partial [Gigaspora margarita]